MTRRLIFATVVGVGLGLALFSLPSSSAEESRSMGSQYLENQIMLSIFGKYPEKKDDVPIKPDDLKKMLDAYQCKRLGQVVKLLASFVDESINEVHSGRSSYMGITYKVWLISIGKYAERIQEEGYSELTDRDYQKWLNAGHLEVPPGNKNGFRSKGPAIRYTREKYAAIIRQEMEACEAQHKARAKGAQAGQNQSGHSKSSK